MLMLLSPAKSQDFSVDAQGPTPTSAELWSHGKHLLKELKTQSITDIEKLMGVSEKIATLNFDRFKTFSPKFTARNAKPCALAFRGDVYRGLDAASLSSKEMAYAQKHLRILSGLYGVLRPLDLMQPYRLEMKTKLNNTRGKDLYTFWDDHITEHLNAHLKTSKTEIVLNLASNEYYKAVKPKMLNAEVIAPAFKEMKNGKYKILSMYAKFARGLMARWVIQNKIENPKDLKKFKVDGYIFNQALSSDDMPVFTRG
jgi:cytoplasmic iron level regulating protein YaaA (DUF328/UPF0246 family)